DMNQRLAAYRRLASARNTEEIDAFLAELRDRYGAPPAAVANLADYARIRVAADRIGLESVDREGSTAVLKFRGDAKLDPAWLLKFVQTTRGLTLVPPAILRGTGLFSTESGVSEPGLAGRAWARPGSETPDSVENRPVP